MTQRRGDLKSRIVELRSQAESRRIAARYADSRKAREDDLREAEALDAEALSLEEYLLTQEEQ